MSDFNYQLLISWALIDKPDPSTPKFSKMVLDLIRYLGNASQKTCAQCLYAQTRAINPSSLVEHTLFDEEDGKPVGAVKGNISKVG